MGKRSTSLANIKIFDTITKRVDHIQILGVLFHENTSKNHINLTENKISKTLSILHTAKFLLNQKYRKNVYFFYTQLYKIWLHCLGKYVKNQIEENIHL